ncbi:GNAT family N-acetyltransferase [Actinoplanes friuliensis]|uniref:N-acetyltransferase domain-containing protein n=1 Tax=Actinoplanes friuliensis DSM 7358 TaxID=1246995 RepID=U5W5A6_9ACTN|nr:GNAT family N-acetyltransferase [Actinoplanes friuliensis]AGZ44329.1 hypothetical protein AFR_30345 [Actinoplanes friuliensis DSM 7358]
MITLNHLPADDDPLLLWGAQNMRPEVRVWALGDAAAVACPDVARRDRLVVRGSAADAAELVRRLLPDLPGFHPIADQSLIEELVERLPDLEVAGRFGWMDTTIDTGLPAGTAHWLTDAEIPEVAALLEADHPDSFALPGGTGVLRWAGIRVDGVLQAVAADAWSVPEIGFVGGVATRRAARGTGLGTEICAFVTREMIGRGRVALLVDHRNAPAIRTYEKLGYRMRRIAAARVRR